jgi:hypothetical protein
MAQIYKVHSLKVDYDSHGNIVQWALAYHGRVLAESFDEAVDAIFFGLGITDRKVNGFPLFENSLQAETFVRIFNERRSQYV